MNNLVIQTPLRAIALKYKKEQPLSSYENELVKKYSDLNIKTGEADSQLQQLKKSYQNISEIFTPLKVQLAQIKYTRQKLMAEMKAQELQDESARIKNLHDLTKRTDVFNASFKSYQENLEAQLNLVGAAYEELKFFYENLTTVDDLCEEVEEFNGELFKNYKEYSLDIVSFDEDWQDYVEEIDRLHNEYKEFFKTWKQFVQEHNAFLEEYNEYMDMLTSMAELEKEKEPPKKDPAEGVGEHYKELAARFENDLQNDTRTYFDTDDWNLIIDYYYHVNDKKKIVLAIERAMAQHPEEKLFMTRQALLHIQAFRYQQALDLLAAVEAKGPPYHPDLYFNKALIYEKMQMPQQAIAFYKKAIAGCNEDMLGLSRSAYLNLANLYKSQKQAEEAIALLKECKNRKHHDQRIINELSYLYEMKGQWQEAEELLSDFLKKNPRFVESWLTLGNVYRSLKKFDKAIETYEQMLEHDPGNPVAFFSKAEVFRQQERYDEAITNYLEAIKSNPSEAIFYLCTGLCYEQMKQNEEAATYFRLALDISPEFPDAIAALKRIK